MGNDVHKIGWAVSTTPLRFNPETNYFDKCVGHTHLHNDIYKEGMASAKNRAIKYLYEKGCKYFVLMDDDTRILNEDFGGFLVDVCEATGIQQISYPDHHSEILEQKKIGGYDFTHYRHGCGAMIFITREVVDKVGFLNTNYKNIWGWAHVAYSYRIYKAGLMPNCRGWRTTPDKIRDYFWCADIDGKRIEQNFDEDQKQAMMRVGKAEYYRELRGGIYKPFSERLNR